MAATHLLIAYEHSFDNGLIEFRINGHSVNPIHQLACMDVVVDARSNVPYRCVHLSQHRYARSACACCALGRGALL